MSASVEKTWKTLEKPPYKTAAELLQALEGKGYRFSDWISDIALKPGFMDGSVEWPLRLARVSLESLGFKGPTHLAEFYQAAKDKGYSCVPPQAALAIRFFYDEQPTGEWLRIATEMDRLIDSDGVPHLPKMGKALGKYYLETYWSYPKAIFHPHNEFVMVAPG